MPSPPSFILVFLAGILTVITPCMLPIIPVVLSGSIGGRFRPLFIIAGMSVTFTLMGMLISIVGAAFLNFAEYLRWLSIFFIIAMGTVLFDNEVNEEYIKISSVLINSLRKPFAFLKFPWAEQRLLGGFFLGMSLGILWIPCVGPILGAVLLYVAASGRNIIYGSTLLFIYSIGVSIPMLIITYSGKKISRKLILRGIVLKKLSGLLLIIAGLIFLFGVDKYIKAVLLPYFPAIL